MKPNGWILILGLAVFALGTGCATTPRPPPLSQPDIVAMVQAGMSDEQIIREIDATRSVFNLNATDVIALRDQGVSERVISYMMETQTRAAVEWERRRSWYYYGYGPYFYYPYSYRGGWYHHHHCR